MSRRNFGGPRDRNPLNLPANGIDLSQVADTQQMIQAEINEALAKIDHDVFVALIARATNLSSLEVDRELVARCSKIANQTAIQRGLNLGILVPKEPQSDIATN